MNNNQPNIVPFGKYKGQYKGRNWIMKAVRYVAVMALIMALVIPTVARADEISGLYEYCEAEYPEHPTMQVFCFKGQKDAIVPALTALRDIGIFDADDNVIEAAEGTKVSIASQKCLVKAHITEFDTFDFILLRNCAEAVKDAYGTFVK